MARHLQRPERKSARSLAGILWALAKTLWPDEAGRTDRNRPGWVGWNGSGRLGPGFG